MADVARLSSAHITRLPPRVALYLQASIIVAFLAASSAPTPLYAVYQAKWGFTPITITTVFGIYALAVLAALLTVGSLSDYVGRRPVLLSAIAIQAAGLVVLSQANGLLELVIGRILQGLATGAAAGAVGAGMLDLDRAKGTLANAIAPVTGLIGWVRYPPLTHSMISDAYCSAASSHTKWPVSRTSSLLLGKRSWRYSAFPTGTSGSVLPVMI